MCLLLYILATALPALIYAIKLHRKVNGSRILDHSSVFGPLMGDVRQHRGCPSAKHQRSRAAAAAAPCCGVYRHPPQQAVQTGMQMASSAAPDRHGVKNHVKTVVGTRPGDGAVPVPDA